MKADDVSFLRFLEGTDKNFVIPVFQRNYDWKKEQCEQLFNDVVDICNNNFRSHFLGTIVSVYNDEGKGQEYLIIDGQQRITTISLMLLVIVRLIENNEMQTQEIIKEKILDEYLVNKYAKHESKIKLKSVKEDQKYFTALINNEEIESNVNSNIILNYNYFKEKFKNIKPPITLDHIYSAITKLNIVAIELKRGEDDPQLIFESMNSTGLNLTQADLVRNFILMRESQEKQNYFFSKYWEKIEQNTSLHLSDFIRDYFTFKENVIPNKDKVYLSFKKYVYSNNLDKRIEDLLIDLLKFSNYYNKIIFSNDDDKNINKCLKYINDLDVSVCYPFLLEVYDDYHQGIISKEDFIKILDIIKSFSFRRLICEVPTNALNKIYMSLGKNIKKYDDYKDNYVEILKYILLEKKDSQRFPSDIEFSEKLVTKDIYNLKGKNKIHLLESLENYNNKEKIDLDKLLKDGDLNIEHIMPQTLSKSWKDSLGDSFQEIQDKYLHTIGNITLTAYNAKMSNKTFAEKKNMENGFKDSKLFLNQYLKDLEKWDEGTIQNRAEILKEIALKIWKNISTNYSSKVKYENSYSLADDHNYTSERIDSFVFLDKEYKVKNWIDFYKQISEILFYLDPNIFSSFLDDEDFKGKSRNYISNNKEELCRYIKIGENIFIETNFSAETIVNLVRTMFKKYEFEEDELIIKIDKSDI